MRVSGISTYVQQVSSVRSAPAPRETQRTQTGETTSPVRQRQSPTPQSVLSHDEQTFFAQLFPEYASQMRSGVQFNRQGQLQQARSNVGVLFDGRA